MGKNDWHLRPDGKLANGLVMTAEELAAAMSKLNDIEDAQLIEDAARRQVHTIIDKDHPMLKGSGFIVVDPKNARWNGEEFTDLDDAKAEGSNVAYQSGTAIIYAPVLVMRPKRDTADAQPSGLLKQLGLPNGAPVGAIEAPKQG